LAAQLSNEPVFDRQKVDQIKQAIEQGQYAVDPKRVAEQFMAIERMIR
jgi:negative regulator of flagellin synthesis FlgM